MASSHSNVHSEAAKMEQIITEFYTKSLHIILESRSPYVSSRNFSGEQILSSPSSSCSSSSSVRPRDKWFNLALRECSAALENLDLWRQSNLEPMFIDVILVQSPVNWDTVIFSPKRELGRNLSSKERYPFCWGFDQEEIGCEGKSEKVVERWVVQYERKVRDCSSGSRRSSNNTLSNVYKKSILLLRSLYTTVRLLPAYKIFRDLNSSGQICTFSLAHRVSSFVEPFTRKEEAEFQRFGFTPVDTSCGRLCISVLYRSQLSDVNSEPLTPLSPQVILDYVGSPLADPLKRLPSLPLSHGSPSFLPFSRRHSWSFDHYKASPPSVSFSPSPTYSEPHVSISNPNPCRYPPMSLPPHPPETSLVHKKNTSFDEYCPSPNFTPSASPSPPIYIPGAHLSKGLLRSESAPFSLPATKLLSSKQNLSPYSPIKVARSGTSKLEKSMGPIQNNTTIEKLLSLGKDDLRRHSGVKLSSNSSPQISFSRSSSRSFQDDFDDDFPCPFDVEDVDMTDPGSRPESFDRKGLPTEPVEPPGGYFPNRKSQDAAVGELVCMLNKAPPLRQDLSRTTNMSEASGPESWRNSIHEPPSQISEAPLGQNAPSLSVSSSGLLASKTTADALEELRSYKEMKSLLLSQGARSHASASYPSPAEP